MWGSRARDKRQGRQHHFLPKAQRGVDTDLWGIKAGGRRGISQEEGDRKKRGGGAPRANGRTTMRRKGGQLYLEQSPIRTAKCCQV